MIEIDVQRYGPAFASLLQPRALKLNFAKPHEVARDQIEKLSAVDAFGHHRIADPHMADAAIAGVWLYHDFLDESHAISQDLDTPTGSYWHAILHRREPDYGNAKYWFARAGRHPVYAALHLDAADMSRDSQLPQARFLDARDTWDPRLFVDLCEQVVGTGTAMEMLAERIQRTEWWMLFDHCYRHAIGQ